MVSCGERGKERERESKSMQTQHRADTAQVPHHRLWADVSPELTVKDSLFIRPTSPAT